MIDRNHKLSVSKQAALLDLSRGAVYYTPAPPSEEDLKLMLRIDQWHLEHPWMGSRKLRDVLVREGFKVGRKHVKSLMLKMGIEALYRRANTSKPNPAHKIYPYLLRNLTIDKPDHVWAMDICYIPMEKGFVYLCAVVDWSSRKVLSHRVSITLDTEFCLEALEEAFAKYGVPTILNTDQGCQFTSLRFQETLLGKGIKISMDGRGCWRDNVFVERIWRSVKYEEIYLRAYASVSEAKAGIAKYFSFYNARRPHSSLGNMTPDEYYFTNRSPLPAVA